MAINSIENATRYSEELDKLFAQKSATGFFADNALTTKFVGAKTVIIPDIDFEGLADYDRNTGFTKGAITVSNTSYTMAMDRARSLQIDREDMDETGVAGLAGKILGEYVRTKVVPECDAYVISKLAGLAATRSNIVEGDVKAPLSALTELIQRVRENVGYDEELVAFIDSVMYAKLMNTTELSKQLVTTDFKQGEINLQVRSLDGVAIIPVVADRMKTSYNFKQTAGGFMPGSNSREVYMMVCPKTGAHLVKKTEQMRIFTPEQNIDADAYKFDYRIYYDVFVKKSGLDAVWAWLSPAINISSHPASVAKTAGSVSGSLTVSASANPTGKLTYQWYKANDEGGNGAVKIASANAASMTIPTDLKAGKYYYFVKVTVDSLASTRSNVAVVTVS